MSGVIRTSVRSRRPWRISSCPAACGIRWVKPSSATTSPSRTSAAIASLSEAISAIRFHHRMARTDVRYTYFRMEVRIAIVGAGSIGVGWAVLFARAGFDVVVHDPDPERLEAAPREVRSRLDELAGFGLLDEAPSVP